MRLVGLARQQPMIRLCNRLRRIKQRGHRNAQTRCQLVQHYRRGAAFATFDQGNHRTTDTTAARQRVQRKPASCAQLADAIGDTPGQIRSFILHIGNNIQYTGKIKYFLSEDISGLITLCRQPVHSAVGLTTETTNPSGLRYFCAAALIWSSVTASNFASSNSECW